MDLNPEDPTGFIIKKYDKRRALPFKYTQFIKFHSNRPVRNAYNIILSQVLPILYLSNSVQAAVDEIIELICTLTRNGFLEDRLRSKVISWLNDGHFPGTKVDVHGIICTQPVIFSDFFSYMVLLATPVTVPYSNLS